MLACEESVCLLQLDRDDNYRLWVLDGVSVYRQVKSSLQERGMTYASETKLRIPADRLPAGCTLEIGDTLVFAPLAEAPRMPSALKGLPTASVVHVGDNRRGRLSHWMVVGK